MIARVATLCAILLGALAACATGPAGDFDQALQATENELDRLARRGLAGQVVIGHRGRIVLARGFGTLSPEHTQPVTLKAIMPLASMTKPFIASLALSLAADGELDLDAAIGGQLPDLSADWAGITPRQLLTHTSGLPAEIHNPGYPGHPRFEPIGMAELLRRINRFQPEHAPGEVFNYSNLGYSLLAALIETQHEQAWDRLLNDRMLHPAGIDGIGLLMFFDRDDPVVVGRRGSQPGGHHLAQPRLDDGLGWLVRGAGDLLARPEAIGAWWQSLSARTWLPEPWMSEFLKPKVDQGDGKRYGYGLEFRQGLHGPIIGHTGSDLDFTVDWSWYPEAELMIYLAAADSRWRADHLSQQLARRLLTAL